MSSIGDSVSHSRPKFGLEPFKIPGKEKADEQFNRVLGIIGSATSRSDSLKPFETSRNEEIAGIFNESLKLNSFYNGWLCEEGFLAQPICNDSLAYESVISDADDNEGDEHMLENSDRASLLEFTQQEYPSITAKDMQELGITPKGKKSSQSLVHRRSMSMPNLPRVYPTFRSIDIEKEFRKIQEKYLEIKKIASNLLSPRRDVLESAAPFGGFYTTIPLRDSLHLTGSKECDGKNIHELFEELLINISELFKGECDLEKYEKVRGYLQEIYDLDSKKFFLDEDDLKYLNEATVDLDSIICMLKASENSKRISFEFFGIPLSSEYANLEETESDIAVAQYSYSESSNSTMTEYLELTCDDILQEMNQVRNNRDKNEIERLLDIFEDIKERVSQSLDKETLNFLNVAISDLQKMLKNA